MAKSTSKVFSKDALRALLGTGKVKLVHEDVPVPELGPDMVIRVREAKAVEREAYEQSLFTTKLAEDGKVEGEYQGKNAKSRLLVCCIVDPESGGRVFEDNEVDALGEFPAAVIARLFARVQHLSGMTKKAAQALEGNSEPGKDGKSSISSSPGT